MLQSSGYVLDENGNSLRIQNSGPKNIAASQTDSAIVAAVPGCIIRVLSVYALAGGTATTLVFNSKPSGAGSAISATFANAANGGEVLPFNIQGWCDTKAGEGLSATTGAGATTGMQVEYIVIPCKAPAWSNVASTTFQAGVSGSFKVSVRATPYPTSIGQSGSLPTGVTFSTATGTLYGTAAAAQAGTYSLVFTASNGFGSAVTQAFTLTVTQKISFISATTATFVVGTAGSFTIIARGASGLTFTETGSLPTGVTFSSAGVLAGTPAAGQAGTYPLTFSVAYGSVLDNTQSFTLTVT